MIHLLPGPGGRLAAGRRPRPSTLVALGLFTLVTLLVAWPVTKAPASAVPGDYGDPVFVMWVMSWVSRQLTAVATGHIAAIDRLWHANIFYPEPATLALSEHFVAQSVQVLPVYWLTHNPILGYNIALLSSFALTALGTFLLARDLWGRAVAALVAGLFAAFNEYRLVFELGHLHVLSIQWLPFALVGLHRFIAFGRRRALWGATLAIIALNLSAGYYLAYCAPFIALFALVEMVRTGRLRRWRTWAGLLVSAICVTLVTVPFVLPYIHMQKRLGFSRSIEEVVQFSATLDHYRAALPRLAIPVALAVLALAAFRRSAANRGATDAAAPANGAVRFTFGSRQPPRQAAMIVVLLVFLATAVWLSLGPVIQSGGARLDFPGLYGLLYEYVPGFTGLRVAARYAALVTVFLALLAGAGAAVVERRLGLAGRLIVLILAGVYLAQNWPSPFPVNGELASAALAAPPSYLRPAPALPPIYQALERVDPDAIVAELPFADPWYELRYMFFSATHGRRLLNGYSGVFPPSYVARQRRLANPLEHPMEALDALHDATHVIIHARAWRDDTGQRLVEWLEAAGAIEIATADDAHLMALHPMTREAHREMDRRR